MKPNSLRSTPPGFGHWIGALLLALVLAAAFLSTRTDMPRAVAGWGAVLLLLGMVATSHETKRIKAGTQPRNTGDASTAFTLSFDNEMVTLEPGKTWIQLDHYKWVVRGLIEAPQNFHVHPDGSVEIYAEKIGIADPEGAAKLEQQINKRHAPAAAHKSAVAAMSPSAAAPTKSGKPEFLVRLDHWGHMVISWGHGLDREETGLRGLPTLIANGLIRKPASFHVDPLQRGVEIDGVNYECSDAGAKRLEVALNSRYVITRRSDKGVAIEIKENHAASTGFDIHFTIHRAGVPLEVRGHLSQENLDILQDPAKCDLLHPGIHLLLAPPNLLFRRRRPDMGEEKISELPDINILHCNAAQLQQALNHPMICRRGSGAGIATVRQAGSDTDRIVELRVARNPADKALLWLECVTALGEIKGPKAFTHHNVTELQQTGLFQPHLEIHLSLDHRRLSVVNQRTRQENSITLDTKSPDEDLRKAGRMLTEALKSPAPRPEAAREPVQAVPPPATATPATIQTPTAKPAPVVAKKPDPKESSHVAVAAPSAATSKAEPVATITALFSETDPVRINREIFRRLVEWLGLTPQEVHLSLEFVFENRRFEILSFEQQEITDLAQLRGVEFYGFYLSHVSEKKVMLVYACNGMHLEWGPDKCVLQPTVKSEAAEYKGSVLLGLAQNRLDEFVFVVKPEFKKWIAPREMPFTEENLQFLTVADIAAAPDEFKLIWPERPPRG